MPGVHHRTRCPCMTWSLSWTFCSHTQRNMLFCYQDEFQATRTATINSSRQAPPNIRCGQCMWRLHHKQLWEWWSSPHLPPFGRNTVHSWPSWSPWLLTCAPPARRTARLSWGLPIGQRWRRPWLVAIESFQLHSLWLHSRYTVTPYLISILLPVRGRPTSKQYTKSKQYINH